MLLSVPSVTALVLVCWKSLRSPVFYPAKVSAIVASGWIPDCMASLIRTSRKLFPLCKSSPPRKRCKVFPVSPVHRMHNAAALHVDKNGPVRVAFAQSELAMSVFVLQLQILVFRKSPKNTRLESNTAMKTDGLSAIWRESPMWWGFKAKRLPGCDWCSRRSWMGIGRPAKRLAVLHKSPMRENRCYGFRPDCPPKCRLPVNHPAKASINGRRKRLPARSTGNGPCPG